MASIRAIRGKKGTTYEVRIRRKDYTVSRVFDTHAEAEAYGFRVEADMVADKYIAHDPLSAITLGQLLERYKESVSPTKKGERQEVGRINQLLKHPLAKRPLLSLSSPDFAEYRDDLLEDDYAESTVNKFLFLFSAVYKQAKGEWGYITLVNPIADIKKCYVDPAGCGRRLSPEEEAVLMPFLDKEMRDLVALALETAGRRSELVNMRWNQVQINARTLTFPMTKSGKARTVPLSRRAVDVLVNRKKKGETVFDMHVDTATNKMHVAWEQAKRVLYERAIAAGHVEPGTPIPEGDSVTFHTMRHEATSRWIDEGFHFHMVQRITGHSTMQMMNRYYHCYVRDILSEMDRIDEKKKAISRNPEPPAVLREAADLPSNVIVLRPRGAL